MSPPEKGFYPRSPRRLELSLSDLCLPDGATTFAARAPRAPPPPPLLPPTLPMTAFACVPGCSPARRPPPPPVAAAPSMPPPSLPPKVRLEEAVLPPPPAGSALDALKPEMTQPVAHEKCRAEVMLPSKILRWDKAAEEDFECEDSDDGQDGGEEFTPSFAQSRTGSTVKFPPGLRPPPNTPSHGSVLHCEGSCRPCAWFWKPGGCKNGQDCGHCHICPEGEIKNRKKTKATILRLGQATPKSLPDQKESSQEASFMISSPTTCPGSEQESMHSSGSDSEPGSRPDHSLEYPKLVNFPPGLEMPPPGLEQGSDSVRADCKPCVWLWKPIGCKNSENCRYCHSCPPEELKTRKRSKLVMMRLGLATPKA